MELLLVDSIFGTEELAGYSKFIGEAEKDPCLTMNVEDAARLGLKNRDRVCIPLDAGPLEVEICTAENMARGMMVLPRHHRLFWQRIENFPVIVPEDGIKKI